MVSNPVDLSDTNCYTNLHCKSDAEFYANTIVITNSFALTNSNS